MLTEIVVLFLIGSVNVTSGSVVGLSCEGISKKKEGAI